MVKYHERDNKNAVYCYVCNSLFIDKNGYPIGHTKTHCCGQETETIISNMNLDYVTTRLRLIHE